MSTALEDKLFLALDNEDVATVANVIEKKCSPNVVDEDSFSPLIIASAIGNLEMITLLVKSKANVSYNGKDGSTALLCAVQEGFVDIAKYLLKNGAKADENHTTSSLYSAAQEGHFKLAKMLLRAKADPNRESKGVCPLFIAAQEGHFKVVKLLLAAKANPDKPNLGGISPLQIATQMGRSDIINTLITGKADINTENQNMRTPLMLAIEGGDLLAVEELIKAKVDLDKPNSKGLKPLILAAQYGDIDVIEQMVRHGTDPTAVDTDGRDARTIVKMKYGEDITNILDAASKGLRVKHYSAHSIEKAERRLQRTILKYAGPDKTVARPQLETYFTDQGYDITSRKLLKKINKMMAKYADSKTGLISADNFAKIHSKVLRRKDKAYQRKDKKRPPHSEPAAPEPAISNPESPNAFSAAAKNIFRKKASAMMYTPVKGNSSLMHVRQPSRPSKYGGSTLSKHHSAVDPTPSPSRYGSVTLMARHEIQALMSHPKQKRMSSGRQLFNSVMDSRSVNFDVSRRVPNRQKLPGLDTKSPRNHSTHE